MVEAMSAAGPQQLAMLARAVLLRGGVAEARTICAKALAAAPGHPELRALEREIASADVHGWHFSIVRDLRRNAAYEAAMRRVVTPQSRVLEIGAGTGLLAMMAARAGAATVVTCEANASVAAAAREIVTRNGFAGTVSVVAKHSRDLDVDADLGGQADVLVSEIVSNDVLSQNALPTYEDARRLLAPGARLIPAAAIARVALAYYSGPRLAPIHLVDGFDLSPFNQLAKPWRTVAADDRHLEVVSDSADLFTFDFQSGERVSSATASVPVTANGGPVNSLVQWMKLRLDDEIEYENDPRDRQPSCWAVRISMLETPLDLPRGATATIGGSHDRQTIRFWLEP